VKTIYVAIVRKCNGLEHISPAHAEPLNQFSTGFLNPYVNCHWPSSEVEVRMDARDRKRRVYKQWRTPIENVLSLDGPQAYGISQV
jgi:hypothetical protein